MPGPKEVVLSLDQGTQSTRVYVFDAQCQPLNSHQVALPQIYPEPGCACTHKQVQALDLRRHRRSRILS